MQITNHRNTSSIRFHLLRLVVASVLPVWLVACVLVYHAYLTKKDQVHKSMLETARSLARGVDRELTGIQSALQALATSPSFARGDLAAVQRQAQQIVKSYPGADIEVADATGQLLLSTSRPFGTPLPRRNAPETVRCIFDSGKPLVSALYVGALTKEQQTSIDVPVLIGGKVAYDLALTLPSDPMASLLLQYNLPQDWYGLILDSRQILVARSLNCDRSVGSRLPGPLGQALLHDAEGITESYGLEGQAVLVTFCRSAASNWSVVVEVPRSSVMVAIYQWIAWALFGAAVISLIGIVLALGYARKIAEAIQSLVNPALSLGRTEMTVGVGSYAIKETEEVAEALVQAFHLLQARAGERDLAEKELLKTVEDLERQTREHLAALEKLGEKDQLLLQQGRQAAMGEMIGSIAHQWRQPLNALGLLIQQAALNFERGQFDRRYCDQFVKKSTGLINTMSSAIDDFRNFFKTDKKKVKFRADAEVKRALLLLEEGFSRERIRVDLEVSGEPCVYGYPNEFSQVLINILTNAKDKFVKRGVADPRVQISLSGEQERTVVRIADNAGGIPEAVIGKIFDPYFTTKEPQSGTGVGLFMSKTLVEKNMGGVLSVRNHNGGAEFSMEF